MENVHPQGKLHTKEDPHNNHTIENHGQSRNFDADWGLSFGKTRLVPRRMELRNKETKAIAKERNPMGFPWYLFCFFLWDSFGISMIFSLISTENPFLSRDFFEIRTENQLKVDSN